MNWGELTSKHAEEYRAYLSGYKASLEKLNQDRTQVLKEANTTEANISPALNNVLNAAVTAWRDEWGMYGSRFKEMRIAQQKEVDAFFTRENLVYRITKEIGDKDAKAKDNAKGR